MVSRTVCRTATRCGCRTRLGYRLMQEILSEARQKRLRAVEGYILCENDATLRMAEVLGFKKVSLTGDMVRMRHEVQARPVSEN
jgi:L-amino acid N-acyltransferase YncA